MIVSAIVEMPTDSIYKYEVDKTTGELVLDRTLQVSVPFNYGYVQETESPDGDPLDIFVVAKDSIFPRTRVKVSIVGVFKCIDNGVSDDKLIGILHGEEAKLSLALKPTLAMVKQYLETYKEGFIVQEYQGQKEAIEIYESSKQDTLEDIVGAKE